MSDRAGSRPTIDSAVTDFRQLLAANPGDERAQIGLGMTYVGKDDSAAALAVFNKLLAVRPSAAGYYGRGLAYVVGADKARGLQDIDKAIALEPRKSLYQTMRSRIADQK